MGGVARRATIITQERERGGTVLLLDAGNSLSGDQDPARRTQGQTSIAAMNLMGYDAMALGSQDLELGATVLRQRIAEARFAVLSANTVISATGQPVAASYAMRDMGGRKLAIIGLSGDTGTREIKVLDPVETVQSLVPRMTDKVDLIILLSHAGVHVDQQIAETVPGIDLIVSGGNFGMVTPWRSEKTGALILHADQGAPGHAGSRLGIARLVFDERGQLLEQSWQRLDLTPGIVDDPAMSAWVQEQMN
jgi:2',3'-cyclic-nucleotide 2'-phosphodiesterase (5'-nucleotidase family)